MIQTTFIVILSAGPLSSPPRVFALPAPIHRGLCSSLVSGHRHHRCHHYNFYRAIPYFCPFHWTDEEAGKQENQGEQDEALCREILRMENKVKGWDVKCFEKQNFVQKALIWRKRRTLIFEWGPKPTEQWWVQLGVTHCDGVTDYLNLMHPTLSTATLPRFCAKPPI